MKNHMTTLYKKIVLACFIASMRTTLPTKAQTNDFSIIPQSQSNPAESVNKVGSAGGKVWETYNKEAQSLHNKNDL